MTEHMDLVTDCLEVDKNPVLDEIPSSALHTFVVISYRTECAIMRFISDDVNVLAAVVEVA
ncbi:hypothetical protein D3C83_157270 [compost metagenome]